MKVMLGDKVSHAIGDIKVNIFVTVDGWIFTQDLSQCGAETGFVLACVII